MLKKLSIFTFLLLLMIAGIWVYLFPPHTNPYAIKQEELASRFGVNIKDYPFETDFPSGYFYSVIKPGMTFNDVHEIVRGYEKVLRCRNTGKNYYYFSEIYYYFGSGDDDAIRFELFYDKQGNFERFQGEDKNSRSIMIFGCEEGLIQN
jgi:hypothetical protein